MNPHKNTRLTPQGRALLAAHVIGTLRPARSHFATDAATVEQIIERPQQRQTYRLAGDRSEHGGPALSAQLDQPGTGRMPLWMTTLRLAG